MLAMRRMTQEQLAGLLGVSQPYIANKLRLLNIPEPMQKAIIEAKLSERHARCLLRLPAGRRDEALELISRGRMTTAQTEILVDRMLDEDKPRHEEFFSPTVTLHRLEESIDSALVTLRTFGIPASVRRERSGDKTYININIG